MPENKRLVKRWRANEAPFCQPLPAGEEERFNHWRDSEKLSKNSPLPPGEGSF